MSKRSRISKLLTRWNKRYKPETKIVLLKEDEKIAGLEDPNTLYIRIVAATNINME